MKKFTLITASVLMALSASAATPLQAFSLKGEAMQLSGNQLLAPAREAIDPANPPKPVTTRPEGDATLMTRDCVGYSAISGSVIETKDFGLVAEAVKDADGNLWFSNNVSQMTTNSWIKAEPNADATKYTMQLPQPVFTQRNGSEEMTYYLVRMAYNPERETFTPTDDQTFSFSSVAGKLTADSRDLLAVALYLQQTDADGKPIDSYAFSWTGYGDYGISYAPQTAELMTPPQGMSIEPWGLMSSVQGHEVYVGLDTEHEAIWVQGMLQSLPYSWTKGDILPDGTVQFVSDQYQGADPSTGHFAFFCGGHTEKQLDKLTGYYRDVFMIDRWLDMQYDPEAKKLWADNANLLMTSTSIEASTTGIAYTYKIENPVIKVQNHVKGTAPGHPVFTSVLPYTSDGMYGGIAFDLPTIDVDYNIINSQNMYWEMFVDDELYTFYTDEYPHLAQSTSRLHFNYGDGYDIMAQGVDHIVYFFFEGAETIGIQSILVEGDLETRSAMQVWDFESAEQFTSGVKQITADATDAAPVATEYYDMTGRRLSQPAGICIRLTHYSDGTTKAQKVAVRHN